jgi:NitT/TauT family transport system ATP-binding protein
VNGTGEPIIAVEGLGVSFGTAGRAELTAICDLTFTVRAGEFVCIVGPSGCGKSTLLNVLAGFHAPTRGQVRIAGQLVTGPGPDRGVVFQQDALFPWLTVRDNILFGPRCRGGTPPDPTEVIALVGLTGFERFYPHELSGGMKQRVALARVLMNAPAVLLLDEPFGALDAQSREEMQEALLGVCATLRPTVVFITHDVDEAAFLADRVLVLSERPARVCAELPSPFAGVARADREDAAFGALRQQIRARLRPGARHTQETEGASSWEITH